MDYQISVLIERIINEDYLGLETDRVKIRNCFHKIYVLKVKSDLIEFQNEVHNNSQIESFTLDCGERLPVSHPYAIELIERFFNVRVKLTGSRSLGGRYAVFYGLNSDIKNAVLLFEYLMDVYLSMWRKFKDKYSAPISQRGKHFDGITAEFRMHALNYLEVNLQESIKNSVLLYRDNILAQVNTVMKLDKKQTPAILKK